MGMDSLNNDVIVHRWSAMEIYKQFTREVTNSPAALALSSGGYVTLALAATSEAEAHRLIYGAPAFSVSNLVYAKFRIACSANLDANTLISVGLAGTPVDDADAIVNGVWAKVLADNTIVIESDDGTTDVDDAITNMSLGLDFRDIVFNFKDGTFKRDIRLGGNQGGYKAILPSIENANGVLRPVCRSTQFTLAAATVPLQPFVQIVKTSSTNWGHLFVKEIEIGVKRTSQAATAVTTTTTTTTTTS